MRITNLITLCLIVALVATCVDARGRHAPGPRHGHMSRQMMGGEYDGDNDNDGHDDDYDGHARVLSLDEAGSDYFVVSSVRPDQPESGSRGLRQAYDDENDDDDEHDGKRDRKHSNKSPSEIVWSFDASSGAPTLSLSVSQSTGEPDVVDFTLSSLVEHDGRRYDEDDDVISSYDFESASWTPLVYNWTVSSPANDSSSSNDTNTRQNIEDDSIFFIQTSTVDGLFSLSFQFSQVSRDGLDSRTSNVTFVVDGYTYTTSSNSLALTTFANSTNTDPEHYSLPSHHAHDANGDRIDVDVDSDSIKGHGKSQNTFFSFETESPSYISYSLEIGYISPNRYWNHHRHWFFWAIGGVAALGICLACVVHHRRSKKFGQPAHKTPGMVEGAYAGVTPGADLPSYAQPPSTPSSAPSSAPGSIAPGSTRPTAPKPTAPADLPPPSAPPSEEKVERLYDF